jgi:endonuclease/exonuclease/phosphatase family metal-dependent hydrolase
VRLTTFNILHGLSPADGTVEISRLAAVVRDLDVDVLALQEVDRDQTRSHFADLTAVAAEAMGAVAHRFVATLSGTPGAHWVVATGREQPGSPSYGIALLSRYPVTSWQVVRLPYLDVRIPMRLPGSRRVAFVREEPRTALVGTLQTPIGELVVANTHLSFVPRWRRRQLVHLRRDLAAAREPVVLMGDLNMPAPKPMGITGYRSLAEAATFPAHAPRRQIDYVLARGALPRVTGHRAEATAISDHRALIVDLAVG